MDTLFTLRRRETRFQRPTIILGRGLSTSYQKQETKSSADSKSISRGLLTISVAAISARNLASMQVLCD